MAMNLLLLIPGIALSAHPFTMPCDHVKGEGEVVKRTVTVAAFHGIEVEGAIDVVLTPAPTQAVEIEAQPNLIDLVTFDVKNGTWTITTSKDYSTSKPFIVHISAPRIDRVGIDGSGNVRSNGSFSVDDMVLAIGGSGDIDMACEAKRVKAAIAGSGNIKVSGTCTSLVVAISGSGDVLAADLRSSDVEASIAGSGDASVNASASLDASIAGSGDVIFGGRPPKVNERVAGSGDVRAAGGQGPY